MPQLTGIDAEIAYQLITQKEQVKYYAKISSFAIASIPLLTELFQKKPTANIFTSSFLYRFGLVEQ